MNALRTLVVAFLVAACAQADTPRCAVCGMSPARYPRWRTSAELADGSRVEFDSPRCLFRFLHAPSRHRPGARVAPNAHVRVVEYYSQQSTDARPLQYVKGSNVMGPMGLDYVPIRGVDEARQFLADHEGDAILSFDEAVRSPP
jgi:nitrous oxide reductase accessory protein NosL